MRRLTVALLTLFTGACAQPGAPPGGPPDSAPPTLVRVSPDTNAVGVRAEELTLEFNEILREGPAEGQGSLESFVVISPDQGGLRTRWRRDRIEVSPEGGFRPNTTYTVTLLPGLTDLRGNRDSLTRRFVFSTGPTLATGSIRGIAFDWTTERIARGAVIEAVVLPERAVRDTLRYLTVADSSGRFTLAHLPAGTFLFRGFLDENRNRRLDPREPFDSATVTLRDSLQREVLAFVHDTLGSGIQGVTFPDSLTVRVAFDRPISARQELTPQMFSLKDRDSTAVLIVAAVSGTVYDRIVADSVRARAVRDSIERVQRADSARRADSTRAAAQPPAATPPRQARPARPRPAPPPPAATRDTATPRPSQPKPPADVVLTLGGRLAPGQTYRLRVEGVRNLLGATRPVERVFTTPRPAPRDTTNRDPARPDSTPPAPPRRPPAR